MAKKLGDISKLIMKHAMNNTVAFRDQFAGDMLQVIARDTAVKTGAATGNWTAQGGSPDLTPKKHQDRSKSATVTRQRADKAIRKASAKDDIYITNAVQGINDNGSFTGEGYIIDLERGKSIQSPPGMMFNKNVARAKSIADNAVREIFK